MKRKDERMLELKHVKKAYDGATKESIKDRIKTIAKEFHLTTILLQVPSVEAAIKVGDTISDIKEGKNAGLISIGVLEGSSLLGLSKEEFDLLSVGQKTKYMHIAEEKYRKAGADYVIGDLRGLLPLLERIEC